MKQFLTVMIFALLTIFIGSQCTNGSAKQKKVFYINSYHQGYGASDEIMLGIKEVFKDKNVSMETFFMDTKRNSSEDTIQKKVKQILAQIKSWNPEIIIASDDDAVKYVIAPHFIESNIPVVFCGVNWTAEPYNLPMENITGMLELLPVRATLDTLRNYYPEMKKLLVLTENTSTELKNAEILKPVYQELGLYVEYIMVDNFMDWKEEFIRGNRDFDVIYLSSNGGITGWDVAEAHKFVSDNIRKPIFSCDDFMMTYAVFGLTKVSREQGEWAAQTALKIMDGIAPSRIPLTRNMQSQAWINAKLAERIDFNPSEPLLKSSKIVK